MTPTERLTCVLCGREGHRSSQCRMQRREAVFGPPKPDPSPTGAVALFSMRIDDVGCMGGWCRIRQTCPSYLTHNPQHVVERLCVPGRDGMARIAFRPSCADTSPTETPWQMGPAASAAGASAQPGTQSNGEQGAASTGTRDESAYPRPTTHATTTGATCT